MRVVFLVGLVNRFKQVRQELKEDHEDTDQGVSCWATSFEKLLDDPAGLHTFAEFLKKEFSAENIYFWAACERYRVATEVGERRRAGLNIFERHLGAGAAEPVNVDAFARQLTAEQLDHADTSLFIQAQKQIFNLMKFDSYPRFIKSDLYKECLLREISGEDLPYQGKTDSGLELHRPQPSPGHSKLKKSRSDVDDRRRKSLLPWARKGGGGNSKSRERGEEDRCSVSSACSSRSSLVSWDLSDALCRVLLPDGATAVVQTRQHQTVGQLVARLLDKRALAYPHYHVLIAASNKVVSLDETASTLGGHEVRVEQRILFRLDLPNRKTVAVKSKPGKALAQVLRPILHKYGYRLEMVTLCLMSENEVVEPSLPVTMFDNQRLQVLTRSTPTECASHLQGWRMGDCGSQIKVKSAATLDEITNRVFEELLQGKSDQTRTSSEQGSVMSEDWGSEHSSGILGRFLRRDSAYLDKHRETRHKSKKSVVKCGDEIVGAERKAGILPPLIAKWKPGVKLEGRSESDVLYEGLKRAQRCRLEDQRGTEINFELPDFLKDKENTPQGNKKLRKLRRESEIGSSCKFYIPESQGVPVSSSEESLIKIGQGRQEISDDGSFSQEGAMPLEQAEEYFGAGPTPPQRLHCDPPPPLPPKPKHLPKWLSPSTDVPRPADLKSRSTRVRRAVYLDQPTSSFV